MLEKKIYKNGNKVYEINGEILTYFYKNKNIKATGPYINEKMEGHWYFYKENGSLWQEVDFKNNQKNGNHILYDEHKEIIKIDKYINGKRI